MASMVFTSIVQTVCVVNSIQSKMIIHALGIALEQLLLSEGKTILLHIKAITYLWSISLIQIFHDLADLA